MFSDDNITKNFTEQTNLHSSQKSGTCINTTPQKIEQFLGIYIFMNVIKMSFYCMFWVDDTRFVLVFETMVRNRFENFRSNFRIFDNDLMRLRDNPLHDKLFKIRLFINSIQINLKKKYVEKFCAIDEIIIPFKGRTVLKQYNKNKPFKWGIKMFAIASKSGFVHNFEIYVRKGTLPITQSSLGISGDIVMCLLEDVDKFKSYKVVIDNWFNSYNL